MVCCPYTRNWSTLSFMQLWDEDLPMMGAMEPVVADNFGVLHLEGQQESMASLVAARREGVDLEATMAEEVVMEGGQTEEAQVA